MPLLLNLKTTSNLPKQLLLYYLNRYFLYTVLATDYFMINFFKAVPLDVIIFI